MVFTGYQPADGNTAPLSAVYSIEGNIFPALAGESGAYVDANSNQSSAALMSFMHPRIVPGQSAANKSTGSVASLAKAFPNNNNAGNSIIVCCGVGNGTAPTISDTNSNTYTQIGQIANGTAFNTAIFLGTGATLGTGIAAGANTVTVNNGGSTASIAMEIYEVFGMLAIPVAQPDQKATNTGSSGTASTSAIAASFPNEIAFAAIGVGTAAQTITPATGWNNDSGQQNPTTPAGLFSFISMSQFLSTQSSVTPQATFTSEPWAMVVATFKSVVVPIAGTVLATQPTASNLNAQVVGAVASAGTNAGNPVKEGAVFNTTQPTVTNGQIVDAQSTARGARIVAVGVDGFAVSQSGTWTVQPGNTPNTSAWLMQNTVASSGGSVPYHNLSAATTNFTNVKGAAAQMYSCRISNTSASTVFFKFYDKATTPGTGDTPKGTVQIPANTTVIGAFPEGMKFTSGFGWAATGAVSDSDNTAIAANCVIDFSLNS